MTKYLVLRKVRVYTEVDGYDCYHSNVVGNIGIPTEYVVELSEKEVELLMYSPEDLLFIPILEQQEVKALLKNAKDKARQETKRENEREVKRLATEKKRKATSAKKKKEKELKQLEKLKQKYGT